MTKLHNKYQEGDVYVPGTVPPKDMAVIILCMIFVGYWFFEYMLFNFRSEAFPWMVIITICGAYLLVRGCKIRYRRWTKTDKRIGPSVFSVSYHEAFKPNMKDAGERFSKKMAEGFDGWLYGKKEEEDDEYD